MMEISQMSESMKDGISTFIGIDLATRVSKFCILDAGGDVLFRGTVPTTREDFEKRFRPFVPAVVAIEVGSVSRLADEVLSSMGHQVVVANARRLKVISENIKKCDEQDAELLARLVRSDPKLLAPVYHRSSLAHEGLSIIRARDLCVRTRTAHINLVRGMAKGFEIKLPACDPESFAEHANSAVRATAFAGVVLPIIGLIAELDKVIDDYENAIKRFARKHVPIAAKLEKMPGIGPITSTAFALAVDDPKRFANERTIAAYFGLVPRRDQSGTVDKKLPITKAGDPLIRRLLTQCAQRILMTNSKDCDLKRFGQRLQNAGKTNKKRSVTAVARKLSVHMLYVMKTGQDYDPQFQTKQQEKRMSKA